MVNKNYIIIPSSIVALFLVAASYFSIQNKNESDWIEDLASDAYLEIADLNIVIPIVALLEPQYAYKSPSFSLGSDAFNQQAARQDRVRFKQLSARSETAIKVGRAEILIGEYQYSGERLSSRKICPLLKRDWAIYFCEGKKQQVMRELPGRFFIADSNRLDLFSTHYTAGGEKVVDQLQKLKLDTSSVEIACDADGKFCTAGVQTTPNTVAVWTVWPTDNPPKTTWQNAESQGRAIKAFVKYAIGSQPDFKKMEDYIASQQEPPK